MATTSDIKNGLVLNHNNGLWQIIEFLHVKPQRSGIRSTKLKIRKQARWLITPSPVKIDPVRIETREYQYPTTTTRVFSL